MSYQNKLFSDLLEILFENSNFFFLNKKHIECFVKPDDLTNQSYFNQYLPINKKTSAENFYDSFVSLIIERITNLPVNKKKNLINCVVKRNINVVIDSKFNLDLANVLKNNENLLDKVEHLVSSYKNSDNSVISKTTESLTALILNNFEGEIHNLIFEPSDTLFELSKKHNLLK